MDENNRTDKDILVKGLKRLGICLLLMFVGPALFRVAIINNEKPLYIPILIVSIAVCISAIILLFLGINTILDSMFKNKK